MATHIPFFGDGSMSLSQELFWGVLRAQKEGTLLAAFLEGSKRVLQDEVYKLPSAAKTDLPDLARLDNLAYKSDPSQPFDQRLAPTLLTILQLGQFFRYAPQEQRLCRTKCD